MKIKEIAILFRCEQQTRMLSGKLINEEYGDLIFCPLEFVDFANSVSSHLSHI